MRERLAEIYHKIEVEFLDYMINLTQRAIDGDIEDKIQKRQGFYVDKLLEYGIIVPPCKVGDTVWCIIEGFNQVMEGRVRRFTVFDNFINVYCGINGYFEQVYMDKDFGKTAFRTREEAEAAVKGGEG